MALPMILNWLSIECGVRLLSNPYPMGNGAAIKAGARNATGDVLVFMDADGQHRPEDISKLLDRLESGYDMVVGARDGAGQASRHRGLANGFYNRLASWMVGHAVKDLTSGFRVVRREKFLEFLYLLPNGFSYPTTITMAFFRAGYAVTYEAIDVQSRMQGTESHIRLWRDGIRFLLIIFKIGTLYSPLKLFAPVAFAHALIGVGYYGFTFFSSRAPVIGNDFHVECFGHHFSDWSGFGADNATDVPFVRNEVLTQLPHCRR